MTRQQRRAETRRVAKAVRHREWIALRVAAIEAKKPYAIPVQHPDAVGVYKRHA